MEGRSCHGGAGLPGTSEAEPATASSESRGRGAGSGGHGDSEWAGDGSVWCGACSVSVERSRRSGDWKARGATSGVSSDVEGTAVVGSDCSASLEYRAAGSEETGDPEDLGAGSGGSASGLCCSGCPDLRLWLDSLGFGAMGGLSPGVVSEDGSSRSREGSRVGYCSSVGETLLEGCFPIKLVAGRYFADGDGDCLGSGVVDLGGNLESEVGVLEEPNEGPLEGVLLRK